MATKMPQVTLIFTKIFAPDQGFLFFFLSLSLSLSRPLFLRLTEDDYE